MGEKRDYNIWEKDDIRELLDFVNTGKTQGMKLDTICEEYRKSHPGRSNLTDYNIKAVYYRYKNIIDKNINTDYSDWSEEEMAILKTAIENKDPQKSLGSMFLEISEKIDRSPESIKQQYYRIYRKVQRQKAEMPKVFDSAEMYDFLDTFNSMILQNLKAQIKIIIQTKKKTDFFDMGQTEIVTTSLNIEDAESVYNYFSQMNIVELNTIITEIDIILLIRQDAIDKYNTDNVKNKPVYSYSTEEIYKLFANLSVNELDKVAMIVDILKYHKN